MFIFTHTVCFKFWKDLEFLVNSSVSATVSYISVHTWPKITAVSEYPATPRAACSFTGNSAQLIVNVTFTYKCSVPRSVLVLQFLTLRAQERDSVSMKFQGT